MTQNKLDRASTKQQAGEHGFTLVELLVVLGIIGLIAALATPQVMRYFDAAKVETTKAQIKNYESALELYYLDLGQYPTTEEGLNALSKRPDAVHAWSGPYIRSGTTFLDAWNMPYDYTSPADDKPFRIRSFGKDRKSGGTGHDADLLSN